MVPVTDVLSQAAVSASQHIHPETLYQDTAGLKLMTVVMICHYQRQEAAGSVQPAVQRLF